MTQISIFKSDSGAHPAVNISDNMVTVGTTPTESLATYLEGLSSEISSNNSNLITLINNETSRAEGAEANITNALNQEINRAKGAEGNITDSLNQEINRAKSAEGNITDSLNQEINRAKSAESNLEPKLGFTPVQQGTGIGQSANTVKIGWDGSSNLKATVDATDLGNFAFQPWVSGNFVSKTSNTLASLSDVSLSTLSNDQFLTYSSASNKWINQSFPLSTDSDNLAQWESTGLLVKLTAPADVSNQYIANAGSDTSGDGSQSKPFATIRHALNRIPDNTSATIWLKAGDTFRIEDGADGYVENGTLRQVLNGGYSLRNKSITMTTYGNSLLDEARNTSGVSISDTEIGQQAILLFTPSYTSDTAYWVIPGFTVTNYLYLIQVTMQINHSKLTSLTDNISGNWEGAFSTQSGTIRMEACNFILDKLSLFYGPGENGSSATLILYSSRFDTTNGDCLSAGYMGIRLNSNFGDRLTSTPIQINGVDTKFNFRITNFNSACGKLECYPGLTVINSASRTYQGIITQNKLDNS